MIFMVFCFWNFGQILIDNHKLVVILIDFFFSKYDEDAIFFIKYVWKVLEFDSVHTNKNIYFFKICLGISEILKIKHIYLISGQYLIV
jgi:hypothetical protein